jgi:type VI secretion system secreted protein Hcp
MKGRFTQLLGAATVAAASSVPLAAHAAQDIFLKLDGIEGESLDKTHKGELDITSFSLGVANSGTTHTGTGSGTTGKASFEDLSVSAASSKASPTLGLYCASGKTIPKATLTVRASLSANLPPVEYYVVTLENVLVSSVKSSGSPEGSKLAETYTLSFSKITWSYTPVNDSGKAQAPVVHDFNIATNDGG